MNRRVTTWIIIIALGILTFSQNTLAQTPPKPNVVLIFVDDLGYGDVGSYGATDIATPNIDQLSAEGIRFTDFYTAPVCGPSRAMLLTGSYAQRVSLGSNHTPSATTGIHSNEITLGEIMRSGGYATGIFGKWHLGDHAQFLPLQHGFDTFFGIPYSNNMWPFHPRTFEEFGEDPRLTAARDRAILTGYAGSNNSFSRGMGYSNLPLIEDDRIVEFNSDQTQFGTIVIDNALQFIDDNSAGPFFVYLPLTAPHVPLHPGPGFPGTSGRGLYGDVVEEIDAGVGRVLAKLTQLGIDDETLVIFISDNGPWLEYGIDGGSAGVLSGGKSTQMEGGIRVPALMRWPGQLAAGTDVSEPAMSIDILPTLAGLAGVMVPTDRTIDGVDMWPYLTGADTSTLHQALFSFHEDGFSNVNLGSIRSGDWKLHVSTNAGTASPIALYNLA
ncbi:MAG: sulfatase family protein, partial [Woeseiaceae bacterium]